MNSAEEILNRIEVCSLKKHSIRFLEQELLNAYKAGMSEAGKIANYSEFGFENPHYKAAAGQIEEAILSARDKKETLP